ncbi:MAG: phage major capsid protein [Oscillospiraceae bacterium]|nr:phage major capsid protein [Oscillospiraceae bacterium]
MDWKKKLIDLADQRAQALAEAEKALNENDQAGYDGAMERVGNLNGEIQRVQNLLAEQQKRLDAQTPDPAEQRDMAEERGNTLLTGGAVSFTAQEVRRAVCNDVTLATGTLVEPTGGGGTIRDPLGNLTSSIVDQVYVQDLTGMNAYLEPYVISELDARGGNVKANAGKARAVSEDPVFGVAEIRPYELNVTTFVDRNLSRLSPAGYYEKIHGMAMRAMRRKLAGLIVNGDGQATPDMYGVKNARNKAGADIFASVEVSGVDETLLDTLYFSYGSDAATGPSARLFLSKADLAAIGRLRNGDKERVFKIRPDSANANTGVIEDGGVIVPYTIVPDLTALSASAAGSGPVQTLLYGDPMNYELGLFGEYSIRVDDSVKAVERMTCILGDAMVGGNLIVDKGFVVAALPAGS